MPDFAREAESSPSTKIAFRDQLLTNRRTLPEAVRRRAADALQAVLTSVVRAQPRTVLAAYVPVGTEPGGADLPEALFEAMPPGGVLLLPVLRPDNDLDWAAYRGTLRAAPRGLREPDGPLLGVDAVRDAGLVVVPALAVDRRGRRLGRGGGSYDRALARTPHARTIALLHDGELVDTVPAEPHDRPVHAAITPARGLVEFGLSGTPDWTK